MKKIAYIRVSTAEQRPDRQINGLTALSDEMHIETLSAVSKSRPVYEKVTESLKPGDVLLIWDLDRAYRSAKDALNELDRLHARGVEIQIANMSIDTSTPYGKFLFTLIGGLAEFERQLLSQRTKEGLDAARARGKRIGRPPKLSERDLRRAARQIAQTGDSYESVAKSYGVSGWTLSRSLQRTRLFDTGTNSEETPA